MQTLFLRPSRLVPDRIKISFLSASDSSELRLQHYKFSVFNLKRRREHSTKVCLMCLRQSHKSKAIKENIPTIANLFGQLDIKNVAGSCEARLVPGKLCCDLQLFSRKFPITKVRAAVFYGCNFPVYSFIC